MIRFAVLLLAVLALSPASAFKYLHRGPRRGAASSFTMLKGHTLTAPIAGSRARRSRKLIDFNVELKKDTVVWDELEEDGATLKNCPRNVATKKASMLVSGPEIDPEDFEIGAAFVIGVDDWEPTCGTALPVADIDPADDTLFFKITAAKSAADGVHVSMDIISGAEVAPVVEIEVREEQVAPSIMPRKVMFGPNQFLPSIHSVALPDNATLSTAVRPTIKHNSKLTLFKGATLSVDARLSAGVRKFRIKRFFKTEVQWEQYLNARVVATLDVEVEFKRSKTGEIFRKPIPKFGFSARIPFVGRVRAGAFIMLDWVAELDVDVAFRSRIEVSYQRREQVTARIIPPRYNAKNLIAGNTGSKGTSSLVFKDETKTDAKVTGFAGVRPAVGLILSLGRKGVEGNIGAKVGLELSTQIKLPPFQPYTGSGLKLGKCNQCHVARAGLSLKGKDLSGQLRVNGKVKKEAVLVKKLFTLRIGTLCAVPRTCGLKPPVTSTPTPTPKPSKAGICGLCKRTSECTSGLVCQGRICTKRVRAGRVCGRCNVCVPGYTCLARIQRPCRRRPCLNLRTPVRRVLSNFGRRRVCVRRSVRSTPRPRPRPVPRPTRRPVPRRIGGPRPLRGPFPRNAPRRLRGRLPQLA